MQPYLIGTVAGTQAPKTKAWACGSPAARKSASCGRGSVGVTRRDATLSYDFVELILRGICVDDSNKIISVCIWILMTLRYFAFPGKKLLH